MCIASDRFKKKDFQICHHILGRKGKIFPVQAMNANEKVEAKDPCILNFRIRWRWASQLAAYFHIYLFIYLSTYLCTYSFTKPLVQSRRFPLTYIRFRALNLKNISSGFHLRNVCFKLLGYIKFFSNYGYYLKIIYIPESLNTSNAETYTSNFILKYSTTNNN